MGLLSDIASDKKKPTRQPPGKPRGPEDSLPLAPASTPAPLATECRHIRTKKILLVGSDGDGELNWQDVVAMRQCLGCGVMFGADGGGGGVGA